MTTMFLKTVAIAATVTAMMTAPVLAIEPATGAEITAALKGKTLQGSTNKSAFAEYYDPDGTIRGKGYKGKWRVKGDTGCMDYGKGEKCWTAFIDGAGSIWYLNGNVDAIGMSLPGNPNKF